MNKKNTRIACIVAGIAGGLALVSVAASFGALYLIAHSRPHAGGQAQLKIPSANGLPTQAPSLPPPLPRINLPAVIVDSKNYGTENNWLAHHIALRIATISYLVLHPHCATVPDFKIKSEVDADARKVRILIENFSASPLTVNLNPDFAWDPDGYAPLATRLLGSEFSSPRAANETPPDLPGELLALTGPELARADLRLSEEMQQAPSSAAIHEKAALVLVGLALRDRASTYTDYRQILCRATAHLALAQALRGNEVRDWSGSIAEAGICTLAGREADALARLDALDARADAPPSIKSWISALRLRAKGDWRDVVLDANSPLLLKIVWAQVLADDLTDLGAAKRLSGLGDLEDVPDWGRCALTNSNHFSVETGNVYAKQTVLLEFRELAQILALETPGAPPQNPKDYFSQALQEKIFYGQPATLHIIGPEMFSDVARRHILWEVQATSYWLTKLLGVPDEAKAYTASAHQNLALTRLLETVSFATEPANYPERLGQLGREHVTWEPWEMATSKIPDCPDLIYPDFHTLHAFYADGLPFGTAYDLRIRRLFSLNNAQLLADDAQPESFHNPDPDTARPDGDSLRKVAPTSFAALLIDEKIEEVIQRSRPLWDFNLQPILWIENSTHGFISEEDNAVLMQKHVLLDPDQYFELGTELRREGKIDDAAAADRKGFDQGLDPVLMSDSIEPLIDYDEDHGRMDEAESISERAANVGSRAGLHARQSLLQKLGRMDEAEQVDEGISDRYGDSSDLNALYAAHPEHFGDKSTQAERRVFPDGMTKVELKKLQGPPAFACVFTTDSDILRQGGLQPGDMVVAFDGYKIGNTAQYEYVRALSAEPRMHLVIWRDGHYLEMNTSAPDRHFQVELDDYPPKAKK